MAGRLGSKLNFLVGVLAALNLLYFLSVLFRTTDNISAYKRFAYDKLNFRDPNRTAISPPRINSTLGPETQVKIDKIVQELNYSRPSENHVYPGLKIGNFLMLNPNLCQDAQTIDIIIIVHTAPNNLEQRQRIRETFAKASLFRPFEVRVAFLLGTTPNKTLERTLWFEHSFNNDTVMGNFKDDYHNLTLKGVMGYYWVSQYCANSRFVLKIDDDVLVNMWKLLYSFFNHMAGKKRSIFCNMWRKNTMPILRKGKWKVESNVFSEKTTFPYDYCSGFLVIMSTDLMHPLYLASRTTPFFWIDDIYLFGMLPSVAGGVTFYNYALRKNLSLNPQEAMNCTRDQGPKCPIFATTIGKQKYWSYWNMILDLYSGNNLKIEHRLVN